MISVPVDGARGWSLCCRVVIRVKNDAVLVSSLETTTFSMASGEIAVVVFVDADVWVSGVVVVVAASGIRDANAVLVVSAVASVVLL